MSGETLKKLAVACLAAIAAGIGTAIGQVVSEKISEHFNPPQPEKRRSRRGGKR